MKRIDLNADMGESFGAWTMGDDAAMLGLVTTANVACGYHAGDPSVMHRTVTEAKAKGVAIGAHPGFHDLFGFGRRPIGGESPDEIELQLIYQISALRGIAAAAGHPITHVKAHGALANQAAVDEALAAALAHAVLKVDPELTLMVMPGLATERAAEAAGLKAAREKSMPIGLTVTISICCRGSCPGPSCTTLPWQQSVSSLCWRPVRS